MKCTTTQYYSTPYNYTVLQYSATTIYTVKHPPKTPTPPQLEIELIPFMPSFSMTSLLG